AGVAVASKSLVVAEGRVRDRGYADIGEAPANRGADLTISARAAGGVGTADGLVVRERTAAKVERPEINNAAATGEVYGVSARAGAPVAAVAGYRLIARERTASDGEDAQRVVVDGARYRHAHEV